MLQSIAHGSLVTIVAVLIFTGLGVPIPEDVVLLTAGAVTHQGSLSPLLTIFVCLAGVIVSDLLLFTTARRLGQAVFEHRFLRRLLPPERRSRVERLLERYGGRAIFIARHMAGLRAGVFAVAAIHGMPTSRFILFDALGACVSVPVMVTLGFLFSANLDRVLAGVGRVEHYIFLGVMLAVAAFAIGVGIRKLLR
jgi:membrane protein DedA with SNARE-associated domain